MTRTGFCAAGAAVVAVLGMAKPPNLTSVWTQSVYLRQLAAAAYNLEATA